MFRSFKKIPSLLFTVHYIVPVLLLHDAYSKHIKKIFVACILQEY